jgi:hypothetical protein
LETLRQMFPALQRKLRRGARRHRSA